MPPPDFHPHRQARPTAAVAAAPTDIHPIIILGHLILQEVLAESRKLGITLQLLQLRASESSTKSPPDPNLVICPTPSPPLLLNCVPNAKFTPGADLVVRPP